MAKKRIQVYTDRETKRRIELAAARRDIAVTQYCLEAIRQQLADDDMLERDIIDVPVKPASSDALIDNLRALHEESVAYRGGEPLDLCVHQIELPRHVFELLEQRSQDRGITPTQQIVEMLTSYLGGGIEPVLQADDPILRAVPTMDSGLGDLSADHDRYLYRKDWQERARGGTAG